MYLLHTFFPSLIILFNNNNVWYLCLCVYVGYNNMSNVSWVHTWAARQYRKNITLKNCIPRLLHMNIFVHVIQMRVDDIYWYEFHDFCSLLHFFLRFFCFILLHYYIILLLNISLEFASFSSYRTSNVLDYKQWALFCFTMLHNTHIRYFLKGRFLFFIKCVLNLV